MQNYKLFIRSMRVMGKKRFVYLGSIFVMSVTFALFGIMSSLLMKCVVDIAQTGDQVVVDPALIAQLGGGPEPWLGKILVPVVQPCPKGHIRPYLSGAVVAALLLQLFQLLHAFLLRLGQHIFCFGIAGLVVAHYHPALPAAVLPQTDGTLAPFSLSCHALTSP